METFSALLTLCAGNSPIAGEFPSRRPVTRSFDYFYLGLNKRLSKHSRRWWFETPSRSLWHRCNVTYICFKFNHMSCHLSTLCDSVFAKSPKWQTNCQDKRITVLLNPIGMCSSWWRHQMETFSALLTLCAGNSPIAGEFPSRRPVTRSFDYFYLGLNKRLSKHSRRWWFETPSRSLWHRCNVTYICFKFNHMSCHLSTLCDSVFAKSPKWQTNCQDKRITVLLKFIDAVVSLPVRLSLRTRNQFS